VSYSPIPTALVEVAPRCCNDDAVRLDDGTWICVWCSAELTPVTRHVLDQRPLPTRIPGSGSMGQR
jgi:hypothetical protein